MEPTVFQVIYPDWAGLMRDYQQQIRLRGLLLRTGYAVDQFTTVQIKIVTPDDLTIEFSGEVVQVIEGQGVAVQFAPDCESALAELAAQCLEHTAEADGQAQAPEVLAPGQQEPEPEDSPASAGTLLQQIEAMTVSQKRRAALRGQREMRLMLIRDRNKTIHPFVIKNPSLTLDEVEQIAKMPAVNPEALRMIAANREWVRSAVVCRNLVRNPKTPMREALALLGKLPLSDIRAMAKSGNVRTAIQNAARKIVAS
jgi:hypothetical protein